MLFPIKIVTFEIQLISMKKFLIPILIIAILVVLYQQSLVIPNLYITSIALVIFMFSMMKLNSKIPSKEEKKDDYIQ